MSSTDFDEWLEDQVRFRINEAVDDISKNIFFSRFSDYLTGLQCKEKVAGEFKKYIESVYKEFLK